MTPFDFINAITHSKKNLMVGTDNDELVAKDYNAFIVNKGLSYFIDTVQYANDMNMYHNLDSQLQFRYLLNTIRPRKRFSKWVKKQKFEDAKLISEHYGYSLAKAEEVLKVLSSGQISIIKQTLDKGGVNNKEKK